MKLFVYVCVIFFSSVSSGRLWADFEGFEDPKSTENIKKFNEIVRLYEEQITNNPNDVKLILAVAEVYYSLKEWPKAIYYYQKALELDPNNLRIKTSLGLSYINNHQIEPSKLLFENVLKEQPKNVDALGGLGRIEAIKHHFLEAELLYQKALAIDPNHFTTLFYLADLRIEEKKFSEAEALLKKLNRSDPNALWVSQALKRAKIGPLKEKARELKEKGEFEAAIEIYKKELNKNADLEIYLALASLYTDARNFPQAIELLNEAKKHFPNESSLTLSLGFTYLAKKDFNNAEYIFDSVLKGKTGQSEALAGLGRIAALRGENREAERYYQRSLEINSLNTLTLSYLGDLRNSEKNYAEAQKIYEQIYQLDPTAVWAKYAAEEAEAAPFVEQIKQEQVNGDFDKAEMLYKELVKKYPYHIDNYLRFAKFYREQKRYDKALNVALEGLKINPQSSVLYTSLAHDQRLNNDLDASFASLKEALNLNSANAEAYAELGRLYEVQGDENQAQSYYERALTIDAKNISALSFEIDLSMKHKNYKEAEKKIDQLLSLNPKSFWADQLKIKAQYGQQFDQIQTLITHNQNQSAITLLEELLKTAPSSEDAVLSLSRLYSREKQDQKSIKVLERGLEFIPQSAALKVDLGLEYLKMRNYEKAKTYLEKALKQDSDNSTARSDALGGLGKLSFMQNKMDEAQKYYLSALKINSQNLLALSYYAEYLMSQKRFEEATKIYAEISRIDPKAKWAEKEAANAAFAPLVYEGKENENKKNYKNAEKIYLKLIEKSPDQPNFYAILGQLYVKMHKNSEAEAIYKKGLEKSPDAIDLLIGLGYLNLGNKNWSQAKAYFEKVLKLESDNGEALAGFGRLDELTGNKEQAIFKYQEALKKNPQNMSALVFLANLDGEMGNYEAAQKLYRKIYQLDPNSKWALTALRDAKHGKLFKEISSLEEAKDYKAIRILYQQLLKEEPNIGDYYLRAGSFYHRIQNYDEAIDTFKLGLKIDPHSSDLYAELGLSYLSKKEPKHAYYAFKRALKEDPQNPDALAGLGYVALIKDKLEKAERLIKRALEIDPERIVALYAYGDLLIKQKNYAEGSQVYKQILELRPKDKTVKLSYEDALNGAELDQIKDLIKAEKYNQAAEIYQQLLQKYPDNLRYYYGLGQMYMRLKQYKKSAAVSLEGLQKNPDSNELKVAVAYAYFFTKNLAEAKDLLNQVLQDDSKNVEAIAGLGRVAALEDNAEEAEFYYLRALELDPKNISAASFYADLLMKQKRYDEAQNVYRGLQKNLPNDIWVKKALQDAQDGPITSVADRLADKEEFELANNLYRDLLANVPDDPVRYLSVGQMYVNLQEYCSGLEVFYEGLELDSEAWYLWRAIGFTYILLEEFCAAEEVFEMLIEEDPEDAEAWAGLGRIQTLDGSYCLAEEYFEHALCLNPRNLSALSYYSDLQQIEGWNFSATDTFYEITEVIDGDRAGSCEPWPKWVTRGYNNTLNLSCPIIGLGGSYHEENQWDFSSHRWSARYEVYGGNALFSYPLCDGLTVWGRVADQYFILKDLINRENFYSFDVQRMHAGARWVLDSYLFIDFAAGISNYSQYRHSSFRSKAGTIFEPSVTVVHHTPTTRTTLGVITASDLVARSFSKREAKLVGYYTLAATHERRVIQRGWVGVEADLILYNDYVQNSSERVLGWFQWRPPCYSDNIIFRYSARYQTFAKNIPDYYTFKPQVVNQLQATLEKNWRVCWADTFYTSLTYGHGWQNTRTRFKQIIVINPIPVKQPFEWDNRQFDTVVGTLIYKKDRLQLTLTGDYYRDTQRYTMWTVAGEAAWRF